MELFCQYFAAVAFPEAEGNSVGFEPDDLMGREVLIKVEWPEGSEYPKVTRYAVVCGIGGWMPAGILLGEEGKEVSASVPAYAGQINRDPTVNTDEAPRPDPAPASSRSDSRPRTWRA